MRVRVQGAGRRGGPTFFFGGGEGGVQIRWSLVFGGESWPLIWGNVGVLCVGRGRTVGVHEGCDQ